MTSPVLPLFLGPTLARWQPRNAADVQAALTDGTLAEHHWVDVKREIPGGAGDKKETARDLASFANDGGCYLIGVEENKAAGTFSLAPVDLAGVAEQVELIARSRCDPPLFVACRPLALSNDNERGVLLVEVPPSPLAPHMVDGTYWGRGDKTKHKLSDGVVEQLHAVRRTRLVSAEQLILREIERDPTASATRLNSHLFVVAEPLASPPELLTSIIGSAELHAVVHGVAQDQQTSPPWTYLSQSEARATGWGWHSGELRGRVLAGGAREERLLDLEVSDDGRVALFCGRASSDGPDGQNWIVDHLIVAHTRSVVSLAANIGKTAGYAGRWLLAIGVTNLQGKQAGSARTTMIGSPVPFSADRYIDGTQSTTQELLDQPAAVTRRLVYRLLRGLGVANHPHESLNNEV